MNDRNKWKGVARPYRGAVVGRHTIVEVPEYNTNIRDILIPPLHSTRTVAFAGRDHSIGKTLWDPIRLEARSIKQREL